MASASKEEQSRRSAIQRRTKIRKREINSSAYQVHFRDGAAMMPILSRLLESPVTLYMYKPHWSCAIAEPHLVPLGAFHWMFLWGAVFGT